MARTGQLIKRGENNYLVRVYLGRDGNGKRKYLNRSVYDTESVAQKVLNRLLVDSESMTPSASTQMTLETYLDSWVEARQGISDRTRQSYREALARVTPTIGVVRLQKLSRSHVQMALNDLDRSPRTVKHTLRVLKQALSHAVRDGLLLQNPAEHAETPKVTSRTGGTAWSVAEVDTFLSEMRESARYALWVCMLTTGMRPQEACALRWEDVELEKGVLHVTGAMVRRKGHRWERGPCKTEESNRAIAVPEAVVMVLKEHRLRVGARSMWVFSHPQDHRRPVSPSLASRWWHQDVRQIEGVRDIRLYDARHTCLTHLLMRGVDLSKVKQRAGHSTITLTADTYNHVMPESEREMAETLGQTYQFAKEG